MIYVIKLFYYFDHIHDHDQNTCKNMKEKRYKKINY